jgi:CTP synthase
MMEEQKKIKQLGGTMRLGTWVTSLVPGTKAHDLYRNTTVSERHRHRYEVNDDYKDQLESAGMTISGTSVKGGLTEMIELPNHPFFLACQFHPEFLSKPNHPHPIFHGFVKAALHHHHTPEPLS